MSETRLSNRQIAALRHLAICTGNGGQVLMNRDQREALQPLWRQGIVEIWYRQTPDANPSLRGPFYRPTERGWRLFNAIVTGTPKEIAA